MFSSRTVTEAFPGTTDPLLSNLTHPYKLTVANEKPHITQCGFIAALKV